MLVRRSSYSTILLVLTVCGIFLYSVSSLTRDIGQQIRNVVGKKSAAVNSLSKVNKCFKLNFNDDANKFWNEFYDQSQHCEYKSPKIVSLQNRDEVKLAFLPERPSIEPETIVTLGVGQDIDSEKRFKEELSKRSIHSKFYGADPMYLDNAKLFEIIGDFFPLAVGDSNGMVVASVLDSDGKYRNQKKYHVEMIDYLKKFVNISHIDHFWMDNEYAEYGLFSYFYKGGAFEKAGITICQLNIEVHQPNLERMEKFKVFAKQILEDNQWTFLKNVNVGHFRLFMFNSANSYCVEKYLQN